MEKEERFIYWKDRGIWLGYLERFPDYWTQGESLEEYMENLRDILQISFRVGRNFQFP